ncbi:putative membrane protein YdfJ with MMPL/SSD domain [Nakamurella sp. UYEF19]|uniref:hypothetical protein n=1 Tax=Nakamurella sp. UYEF19 TaxID=1756392 RepID=UPI00339A20AB
MWRKVGTAVVRHRWWAAIGSTVVLLPLAAPVLGLRLGQPTNSSLASTGGTAADAIHRLETAGLSDGLTQPVEVLTTDPDAAAAAIRQVPGVAATIAPAQWAANGQRVVEAWPDVDSADPRGTGSTAAIRVAAEQTGAWVGGVPTQDADFIRAVYGNAWWVAAIIAAVTFALLGSRCGRWCCR